MLSENGVRLLKMGSGFTSSQNNDILEKIKMGDKHGQKTKNPLRGRPLPCHRSG